MQHAQTLKKIDDLIAGETDATRAMEGVVRTLEGTIPGYSWVGIYLLHGNELVLGPFVGKPSPHTRIPVGRGICGAAARKWPRSSWTM